MNVYVVIREEKKTIDCLKTIEVIFLNKYKAEYNVKTMNERRDRIDIYNGVEYYIEEIELSDWEDYKECCLWKCSQHTI